MYRYAGKKILKTEKQKPYFGTIRYPIIKKQSSDIYVVTTQGDRYDLLARQFYQDESLWWIISIANEDNPQNSLIIPEGITLRIPQNTGNILSTFRAINSY